MRPDTAAPPRDFHATAKAIATAFERQARAPSGARPVCAHAHTYNVAADPPAVPSGP